ncbi:unnamed protein product, partial [Closterium sp. NIES-53]
IVWRVLAISELRSKLLRCIASPTSTTLYSAKPKKTGFQVVHVDLPHRKECRVDKREGGEEEAGAEVDLVMPMEVSGAGTEWPMRLVSGEQTVSHGVRYWLWTRGYDFSCHPLFIHQRHRLTSATRGTFVGLTNLDGLSDAMLAHVSTIKHLTAILLNFSSRFSVEGIKHLYRLPRLERLHLGHTIVSDNALEGIGSLTRLKTLGLGHTKVTDAGLRHLTALSSLEVLGLSVCTGVTNAGMVHVGRLTGLEALSLGGAAVTDDGLHHLTGLSSLKKLCLSKCTGVTNAGMVHVGKLTGLENLGLDGTADTDDGLQQLTALTKLRSLQPPEGGELTNYAMLKRVGMDSQWVVCMIV